MREAVQALNESLRVAQEFNDDLTLTQALTLLCQLLEEGRLPSEQESPGAGHAAAAAGAAVQASAAEGGQQRLQTLLHRCLDRSIELRLPHLLCFARLALARLVLTSGSSGALPVHGGGQAAGPAAHQVDRAVRDVSAARFASAVSAVTAPHATPVMPDQGSPANPLDPIGFAGSGGVPFGPLVGISHQAYPVASAVADLEASGLLLRHSQWRMAGCGALAEAALQRAILALSETGTSQLAPALALLAIHKLEHEGPPAAERVLKAGAAALTAVSAEGPEPERYLRFAEAYTRHTVACGRGDARAAHEASEELSALVAHSCLPREWAIEAEFRQAAVIVSGDVGFRPSCLRALSRPPICNTGCASRC